MSLPAFLPLAISLAICLVPVYFLQRKAYARAQDYFISSDPAPPGVIQNSSIAYALKMATFGPFFAWGASGDFWPAIINSAFLGLGLYLIYILRRPMLAFLDSTLRRDQSVTVHEFIARQHGNDPRVRLLASGLTVLALFGLAIGEALGVATMLKPMLSGNVVATHVLIYGMLIFVGLYTVLSGNSGVMHSAQVQLGLLYLGLFGSTALLLYLLLSDLNPLPPHGTFAILLVVACCAILFYYRRSRYVDTSPIRTTNSNPTEASESGREPSGARLFRRFEKILNPCISVFLGGVIAFALMELYSAELPAIARDSAAALQAGTRMPIIGLIALLLLPLFYPMVDITNWQRIAAFEKGNVEPSRRPAAFRGIFRIYAVEAPLVSLLMCMFGAIAVVSTATPDDADVMQALIEQLVSQQNLVATSALSLLLVSVFAIALSTMSALFSASLCAFRYDILPAISPELASGKVQAAAEAIARRRTILAGGGLCLAMIIAFSIADAYLRISFTSSEFLALLFAFYCAQLSFVPLILGPLIGRTSAGFATVSPGWALVILSFGAAIGVGAVTAYLTTGNEPWLWAAVPACLGSGLLLFTMARLWPGETARAA
jgi:hypothetical protein